MSSNISSFHLLLDCYLPLGAGALGAGVEHVVGREALQLAFVIVTVSDVGLYPHSGVQ